MRPKLWCSLILANPTTADSTLLLKNLAQQLAIFATGRELAFSDRDAIAALVASTQKQGGGVRTLIHELTQSRLFQTR